MQLASPSTMRATPAFPCCPPPDRSSETYCASVDLVGSVLAVVVALVVVIVRTPGIVSAEAIGLTG